MPSTVSLTWTAGLQVWFSCHPYVSYQSIETCSLGRRIVTFAASLRSSTLILIAFAAIVRDRVYSGSGIDPVRGCAALFASIVSRQSRLVWFGQFGIGALVGQTLDDLLCPRNAPADRFLSAGSGTWTSCQTSTFQVTSKLRRATRETSLD